MAEWSGSAPDLLALAAGHDSSQQHNQIWAGERLNEPLWAAWLFAEGLKGRNALD